MNTMHRKAKVAQFTNPERIPARKVLKEIPIGNATQSGAGIEELEEKIVKLKISKLLPYFAYSQD